VLVEQIRVADLSLWRSKAQGLEPTAERDTLTRSEIEKITRWLEENLEAQLPSLSDGQSEENEVSLFPQEWNQICSRDLSRALECCLEHAPARFWALLEGNLEQLLSLGLCPSASIGFLTGPFCEWVYIVDLDSSTFRVGIGMNESAEEQSQEDGNQPTGEACGFEEIVSFPLDKIPDDWILQVRRCTDSDSE
jgi:hypothetical protein